MMDVMITVQLEVILRKDHVPRLWDFWYGLISFKLKYVVVEGVRNKSFHGTEVRSVTG